MRKEKLGFDAARARAGGREERGREERGQARPRLSAAASPTTRLLLLLLPAAAATEALPRQMTAPGAALRATGAAAATGLLLFARKRGLEAKERSIVVGLKLNARRGRKKKVSTVFFFFYLQSSLNASSRPLTLIIIHHHHRQEEAA